MPPLLRGETKAHESYFGGERGRGAKRKISVCGILERQGKVKVEIVEEVSAESLLRATTKEGQEREPHLHGEIQKLR